jgi:ubiquinone/menaquinone biosynthesis C-methylase UbiE
VFDAVTCAYAFYELKGDTQDKCLREIGRVLKSRRPFLMMEHDIPENPVIRAFFYVRMLSMGPKKALQMLRHEIDVLSRYFKCVKKIKTPTGRSKIIICRVN